ncbi:hypothetical protein [Paraliobacillus ryukyuensis]|uniref:hypothetical protein n=1 Tax=Paraliobacillus ryukyuensis TaxID=200904 RepID=UPI0009A748A7|nr:hypothetical protein [Paraliobacillus ryukyuensis]
MKEIFDKPKRFGEILDLTFQISKRHFSKLFLLLLIFMAPVIVIQAIGQIIGGRNFLTDISGGKTVFDQILNTYDQTTLSLSNSEVIGLTVSYILMILFYPVAFAAIVLLVKKIKEGSDYTIGGLIKQAFTRFWPLLWSTLLIGLMAFGIIFFPLVLGIAIGSLFIVFNPILGGILIVLFSIGGFIGVGLLFTRWGFYLPALLFKRVAPGLTASWRLTKGRTWKIFGIYVVLIIISTIVSLGVDSIAVLLGQSVLYTIITNLVTLITTLFATVGYAVVYFDAVTRNTAGDLKDMIDTYQEQQ